MCSTVSLLLPQAQFGLSASFIRYILSATEARFPWTNWSLANGRRGGSIFTSVQTCWVLIKTLLEWSILLLLLIHGTFCEVNIFIWKYWIRNFDWCAPLCCACAIENFSIFVYIPCCVLATSQIEITSNWNKVDDWSCDHVHRVFAPKGMLVLWLGQWSSQPSTLSTF